MELLTKAIEGRFAELGSQEKLGDKAIIVSIRSASSG